MNIDKPYSEACARNREPILSVLREHFADRQSVLEIGSGTGQHAVHFAQALPQLRWQTSDRAENHDGIGLWLDEAALPNALPPLLLDIDATWPQARYDAIYTANTLHIVAWPTVQRLFEKLPGAMTAEAKLVVYGPFNYGGRYTSDSNAEFDASLRASDPQRGIRDFEAVDQLAQAAGLSLCEDRALPANNRCIVWSRRA